MTKIQTRYWETNNLYKFLYATTNAENTIVDETSKVGGNTGNEVVQNLANVIIPTLGAGMGDPLDTSDNAAVSYYFYGIVWIIKDGSLYAYDLSTTKNNSPILLDSSLPVGINNLVVGWDYTMSRYCLIFTTNSEVYIATVNSELDMGGIDNPDFGKAIALLSNKWGVFVVLENNSSRYVRWDEAAGNNGNLWTVDENMDLNFITQAQYKNSCWCPAFNSIICAVGSELYVQDFCYSPEFKSRIDIGVDIKSISTSEYGVVWGLTNNNQGFRWTINYNFFNTFDLPSIPSNQYNTGELWGHIYEIEGMLYLVGTKDTIMVRSLNERNGTWFCTNYRGIQPVPTGVSNTYNTTSNTEIIGYDSGRIILAQKGNNTEDSTCLWLSESYVYTIN